MGNPTCSDLESCMDRLARIPGAGLPRPAAFKHGHFSTGDVRPVGDVATESYASYEYSREFFPARQIADGRLRGHGFHYDRGRGSVPVVAKRSR